MRTKSKVQSLKSKVHRQDAEPRSRKSEARGQRSEHGRRETEARRPAAVATCPGSCALASRWRCWAPAASVPGRSKAAGRSPRTSQPGSSSRPWCKVRTQAKPRNRTRKPSRCGPIPCPPARESSNPRRPLPPSATINHQLSTYQLAALSHQLAALIQLHPQRSHAGSRA